MEMRFGYCVTHAREEVQVLLPTGEWEHRAVPTVLQCEPSPDEGEAKELPDADASRRD